MEPTKQPASEPHMRASFYATKPTRSTLFLRTFLPWQLWRFAMINLRMLKVISMSHRGDR